MLNNDKINILLNIYIFSKFNSYIYTLKIKSTFIFPIFTYYFFSFEPIIILNGLIFKSSKGTFISIIAPLLKKL